MKRFYVTSTCATSGALLLSAWDGGEGLTIGQFDSEEEAQAFCGEEVAEGRRAAGWLTIRDRGVPAFGNQ